MAQVIILSIYPKEQVGSAMGIYGLAIGAAAFGGLVLGIGNVSTYGITGWQVFVPLAARVITAIAMPFAGKLYDKLGIRQLFISGALCLVVSNCYMYFVTRESALWIIAVFNIIRCVAIGCLLMPLVTWGAKGIDTEETSHATALLTSLRAVCGSIGSASLSGL